MRLIGNKTHGDLAEIAIAEFINQYMYDFKATHVGKDLYRAKSHEEDITIINEITKAEFPVSLKAYGIGDLQLSTDKQSQMFRRLSEENGVIEGRDNVKAIFDDSAFTIFNNMNVLSLIYHEKKQQCNILVLDYETARNQIKSIAYVPKGGKIKYPRFRFYDENGDYIFEVRYGNAAANALQRGLWTNTKRAERHFDSVTNGWISYSHNRVLIKLFSHALLSTSAGHEKAFQSLKEDIKMQKQGSKLS